MRPGYIWIHDISIYIYHGATFISKDGQRKREREERERERLRSGLHGLDQIDYKSDSCVLTPDRASRLKIDGLLGNQRFS